MEDCILVCTPMATGCKLSKDDESPNANQTLYRSMIGNLLYVTTTRPDIMQTVGYVARFQATPNEARVHAIKRIFKYLKGIMEYGLWYPTGNDFLFTSYTDADWGGSVDDWKSTSGGTFFLGKCLVSWHSKKQAPVSLSTAEAEYIAAVSCCTQVLWMKQTLQDFKVYFSQPIPILCDNMSAISISKIPVLHSRTKHIPIKYHFLREQVSDQQVKLEYVSTKDQLADIFTKPLPKDTFERIRQQLGVISLHY
ncbi:secreted RxLR effector protein 161-like [Cryptomeria japonica]|uniref:secreted RxLR effector protein 161-like n=1 Tax=Cryptomeria japonica TaxID=3369 RepID=UPI0025AC668B|nr:secreted RxLR effector protein 161-like [Cryptomeria japonica]